MEPEEKYPDQKGERPGKHMKTQIFGFHVSFRGCTLSTCWSFPADLHRHESWVAALHDDKEHSPVHTATLAEITHEGFAWFTENHD